MSVQRVSSSNPASFSGWKYDAFLSFRGEDTRKNFTAHLYAALNQKGINVFMDDRELERGNIISAGLFNAIEESRFSIVVFSRNYAYSTWCLDELVKIVQCKNTSDQQMIFPIFYDVEPTVVRKQEGIFQQAFAKYEEALRENAKNVQLWRDALKEVANISGWELRERNEAEFIQEIVQEMSRKLRRTTISKTLDDLVGIKSRLKKLRLLIGTESGDVRMIGICGMGGIGKTTIARVVYDAIRYEFEGSSFLANVREISEKDGLIPFQKQLLSEILMGTDINIYNDLDGIQMIKGKLQHKKVLVIIDDVVHLSQLNKLAGKHSWFGSGSRIIITTRDEHLLTRHGVDQVYKAELLNDGEALKLFRLKAFDSYWLPLDYVKLANHIVKYASGLPLALDVLGSFLFGRTVEEWKSTIERLDRDSEIQILDILKISFDGLKETKKKIFLDIAFFFRGEDRDYVSKILDGCGFDPVIGISVLIDKSLVSVLDNNKLWMHDLLQEMCQQIVKSQSPEDPGKRSRLLKKADVCNVLTEITGTELVEGIIFKSPADEVHLSASAKAFSKMTNLRLLKIGNVQLPEGLAYLSNKLRLLEWYGYPLKSLPSSLLLDLSVGINMPHSHIKQLWTGSKTLSNLKFMRLGYSNNLIKTPDFTGVPNLEELILEGCTLLFEIHPSLLVHKKLILLNMRNCTNLTTLPSKIYMESLRTLVLTGCSKLKKFPEIVGRMECLLQLLLDGTAIKELPLSIELMSGLLLLNLEDCTNLKSLPSTINGLKSLKTLILSGCAKCENVPENLGQVESLEVLDISGTAITQPMSSIFFMKNLKAISFQGCKGPTSSRPWFLQFPFHLKPRSLDPIPLMLPSLSGLRSLTKLDLSDCNLGEGMIPNDIGNLLSLEELNLSKNNIISLPGSINHLSKLGYIVLKDCKRLQSLPELPSSIQFVEVNGCTSLETLSSELKSCHSNLLIIESINCLKLFNNDSLAYSMLKGFLEEHAESNPRTRFHNVVPGSKIPEWFSYQNEGSSITIIKPPDSYKKYKLVGYAICSVFHVHKLIRRSRSLRTHALRLRRQGDRAHSSKGHFIPVDFLFDRVVPDHIWLLYLSRQECFDGGLPINCKRIKFSFESDFQVLQVKRCGVHPVYVYEVEKYKWNSTRVYNLSEFHHHFSGSTLDVVATTSKPSLPDCDEADDGDEEQQANRFKTF